MFEKFIKADNEEIQVIIMNDITKAKRIKEEKRHAEIAARQAEEKRKNVSNETTTSTIRKIRNIEDGFDEGYHVAHLARNPILTYQEVQRQFNIRISGFGRGINKTPSSVVLISSIDKKKPALFIMINGQQTVNIFIPVIKPL